MHRGRVGALAIVLSAALAAASACSSDDGKSDDSNGSSAKVTLNVDDFGNFGYQDLFKQFEAQHPNIKINERNVPKLDDYTPRLQQWIAAGAGAGDVVALEEGIVNKFMAQPDKFVDLKQYGASSLQTNYLPWKWQAGISADGSKLIGLGTDVGSMALCYRTDLFKKAGLPTQRDEVTKLWPTWDDFINVGKRFTSRVGGDTKFIDSPETYYNTILMQEAGKTSNQTYFDRSNKFIMESNPAVKAAFDETVKMSDAGLANGVQFLSDPWSQALKKDAFATAPCPAWMLGLIKQYGGDGQQGKWDVAGVPGGGGNWGGSWLAVPQQSKHPKEAAELAKFLTSPQGQIAAFKSANNLPSSPQALNDPSVKAFNNPYFNNAPVGQIYGTTALGLKPVYLGSDNQEVRQAVEADLRAIAQKKLSSSSGWSKAVSDAKKAAGL
ncbi:ABC transporter substrate-binding protein [Actinoallomurus soli]|uniref:ABC transporter substrate-binding protein n=1 Tax=Actinoallomurus soli TaxID=2952535 RepID=UPI002093B8B5|nr:extracellular solute-binding protein [Actinoallomurus soli]MCO5974471.1 extracellular solute-binding protein [Actinoallomurus soli]